MDRNKLIATLQQIKALAEESLGELDQIARGRRNRPPVRAKDPATPKNLPGWILKLRDEGLFKQSRTAKEAHAKLQSHYPCDLNRVEVALLRLQKRRQLRKVSKGVGNKKQVAYVW